MEDKSIEYQWHERVIVIPPRGKLMKKIPMEQKVLDNRGMLWKYYFTKENEILWISLGYFVAEPITRNIYDNSKK